MSTQPEYQIPFEYQNDDARIQVLVSPKELLNAPAGEEYEISMSGYKPGKDIYRVQVGQYIIARADEGADSTTAHFTSAAERGAIIIEKEVQPDSVTIKPTGKPSYTEDGVRFKLRLT